MYCGESIPAGTEYLRWAERVEGKTLTCKAHIGCEAVSLLAPVPERSMDGILNALSHMSWKEVQESLLRVGPEEEFRVRSFWEESHAVRKPSVPLTEQEAHEEAHEAHEEAHEEAHAEVTSRWEQLGNKLRGFLRK